MADRESKVTLFEKFLETVERFPNNVAVEEFNESQVTYSQLLASALSLAQLFKSHCGQSRFVVPILPSSLSLIATTLATLSISKTVAILHDSYTAEQLEKILFTLDQPLVVTTKHKWDSIKPIRYKNIIFLESDQSSEILCKETSIVDEIVGEDDGVAYCFFTSGSTGEPKPVLVRHASIYNALDYQIQLASSTFTHSVRGLMSVSPSFIVSLHDIWLVFLVGGTICIPPPHIRMDMDKLRPWVTENRITAATFATPLFELFVSKDLESLTTLRWLSVGGSRLGESRVSLRKTKFDCFHIYGSTECFGVAISRVPSGTEWMSPSVGKPFRGVKVYILDDNGHKVASGIRGEVHVAGAGIMKAYYKQEELTSNVLMTNPFDPDMGHMYRTGDIGYWSVDGDLFIVGRRDFQVKIHGIRLELEEIETALSSHPAINQTAVIVREISNSKQIHAFCTLRRGESAPKEDILQEFLSTKIQKHGIPHRISFIDDFPKTHSGKIKRSALVDVTNPKDIKCETEYLESPLMATVRRAWEEGIGLPEGHVLPQDNFFYLGGNSVTAFKVMGLLRSKELKLTDLNPMLLFQHPILRDFVETLSQGGYMERVSNKTDFNEEILLGDDIQMNQLTEMRGHILLTGVTGYLGPLLLLDILKERSEHIICIIRATDDTEALKRFKNTLDFYNLGNFYDESLHTPRVRCIAGDLTDPMFGLSKDDYKNLTTNVAVIYHSAAEVSFMKTYDQLRMSTVAMTINIIRFAMEGNNKELHFMSSIGVFDGIQKNPKISDQNFLAYEGPLPVEILPERMLNGYNQSKWVSEQLVWRASMKGLRVTIYRIAQLGAHSVVHMVDRRDALAGFLISCIALEQVPETELSLPFVGGDEASRAIVLLSLKSRAKEDCCQVYHVTGTEVGLSDFISQTQARWVSLESWETLFHKSCTVESEEEINAWLFLRMLHRVTAEVEGSYMSPMKNIRFDNRCLVEALSPNWSFDKEKVCNRYIHVLTNIQ